MTIYDIASEAEVSISSVSRYFNHPELISKKIRGKIDAVLEKHDFIPNQMARGLVLNSTKSIGIMMNDIQHQRFSIIASHLEQSFFGWGYNTLFCNTGNDIQKIQQYLAMLSSRRVDALILIGSTFGNHDLRGQLKQYFSDIPVIASDTMIDLPNCHSVTVDHDYGIQSAVEHLVSEGHSNLAFIASTNSLNTARKEDAFHRALHSRGLPEHENGSVVRIPITECQNPNFDFVSILRSSSTAYTGLIFSTDRMAARAVSSIQYHGYRVPNDYAIVGYDNSPYALCCQPTLTSIDTQSETIAKLMANLANDVFHQKETGNRIIIHPVLVIRGSTRLQSDI